MIRGIQLARIILSSSVFFWHFFSVLSKVEIFERNEFLVDVFKGEEAVVCFFLLSGFLFGYKDIGVSWIEFVKKRFIKIAPLYYSSLLLGLPLLLMFYGVMGLNIEDLKWIIAGYLLFLPELVKSFYPQIYGFLDILWSLGVEMLLYVTFPLLARVNKGWKIVSLIGVFIFLEHFFRLDEFYIIMWPGIIGFYVGRARHHHAFKSSYNMEWILLSIFVPGIPSTVLVAIFTMYLISAPLDKIKRTDILNIVGVSSFAFYVIHVYFIYGLGKLLLFCDIRLSLLEAIVGSIILYIIVQWISFIVEYKYVKWLNNYLR